MGDIELQQLFMELYSAGTETDLQAIIDKRKDLFDNPANWKPLGGNDGNS
jgi:hypothetical protein